jgi:hypothetical protein
MHASTLRHAADTVGETVSTVADAVGGKVSNVAHTVAEKAPEVTHRVGDVAYRLAAKTPWVEPPKPTHRLRTWVVRLAVLAAAGAVAAWFAMRRQPDSFDRSDVDTTEAPTTEDRRQFAAVGS